MEIGVIGTGYVGLIQSVGLAELGHNVVGIEIDKEKIKNLNKGEATIYEDKLEELLKKNIGKNLIFSSDYKKLNNCGIIFICVGTPQSKEGKADLSYIFSAAKSIRNNLDENYKIVFIKSTVPVGTNRKVKDILRRKNIDVVSNPEFLREGNALFDFFNPDRIVLGFESEDKKTAKEKMLELYKNFDNKEIPFITTNWETAEIIKYTNNGFLATKISFINEIGNLCKKFGVDVYKVAEGIGSDKRIDKSFLNAGLGFGGSCFPKDVNALISIGKEVGEKPNLLEEVVKLNDRQPLKMLDLLRKKVPELKNKKIAVLGLAFKPETDDVRESRAIRLIEKLKDESAMIYASDPKAINSMKRMIPEGEKLTYLEDAQKAIDKSEIVLIVTEWPQFADLDYKDKLVMDGRNVIPKEKRKNLNYEGLCC